MMPEIDGYEVLAEIRNHPVTATTPFIFMTALTERENQRQGMELGADDYITKPCTATELLKAVFTQL